jgi:hypothetical protein
VSALRAFGAFWYDFLVGDRPEIFLGSIAALVIVWVALMVGVRSAIAGPLLVLFVLLIGGFSLWLAARPRH